MVGVTALLQVTTSAGVPVAESLPFFSFWDQPTGFPSGVESNRFKGGGLKALFLLRDGSGRRASRSVLGRPSSSIILSDAAEVCGTQQ